MGEMADFELERVCEMEERRLSYRMGEVSDGEAYEEGIIDELGYEIGPYSGHTKLKSCRCCGENNLHWEEKDNKWRLFDNKGIHNCPKNPLSINPIRNIKMSTNNTLQQLLPIPSWNEFFMRHMYLASSKSKDPRSKIGAILVRDDIIISEGYNGFSRGVRDLPERYLDRETKYKFVVHAECNAILNAARHGISTNRTILYTNGIPCENCGKSIIQAGISEVIIHKQWPTPPSSVWAASAEITKIMFHEAGIIIREFDGVLGMQGVCDGKIVNV
jgi:dCMP deaminase